MNDLLPFLVGAAVAVFGYAAGACYVRWLLVRIGDDDV